MKQLIFILTLAATILGCGNEKVESLDQVERAIPDALKTSDFAVFVNKEGEEWTFTIDYSLNERTAELQNGNSIKINSHSIRLKSTDEIDTALVLILGDVFIKPNGVDNNEFILCSIIAHDSEEFAQFDIPFAYDFIESDDRKFHESIMILNRPFTNVYAANYADYTSYSQLYYNEEVGIIGLSDMNNELWVFDRYE